MAIGTKELAVGELDTFDDQALVEKLRESKEELFNLRFQSATNQLEAPSRIREVRRTSAKIKTLQGERSRSSDK